VTRRNMLADRYQSKLNGMPLVLPKIIPEAYSAWHLYIVQLQDKSQRKEVFAGLRKDDIGVNVHYIPVHMQPYYQKLGFRVGQFPAAEAYYRGAISIPLYASMTTAEQDQVVECLGRRTL